MLQHVLSLPHPNKDLPKKTIISILKQAGLQ
ncbi:type II toxin-antitoxin system HicA family toxin [Paenibacillus sp. FSL M7-0420]